MAKKQMGEDYGGDDVEDSDIIDDADDNDIN